MPRGKHSNREKKRKGKKRKGKNYDTCIVMTPTGPETQVLDYIVPDDYEGKECICSGRGTCSFCTYE